MAIEKVDLYYKGKIIGYTIIDYEKKESKSYITAPIGVIQKIINQKKGVKKNGESI